MHVSGKAIFCETDHEDMYAAIDALVDKLDRQILKHKGRNVVRRNGPALKHQA